MARRKKPEESPPASLEEFAQAIRAARLERPMKPHEVRGLVQRALIDVGPSAAHALSIPLACFAIGPSADQVTFVAVSRIGPESAAVEALMVQALLAAYVNYREVTLTVSGVEILAVGF
jgi:hypothetical protein